MAMQRRTWSISALAAELRMDRRTLAKALDGLPPAQERQIGERTEKKWLLADVFGRLLDQRIEELIGTGGNGQRLNLEQERARLARGQADKVEMENRRLRGELVPVATVRHKLEQIMIAFRSRILSIPAKLAPLVVSIETTPEARGVIEDHLHDALHELSRLEVSRLGAADTESDELAPKEKER